jgi:hypothetical protein
MSDVALVKVTRKGQMMGWSHESLSAIERRCWSDLERPFWDE